MHVVFSESLNNFYQFFRIFNLDIFLVLVTPTTVFDRSFRNFTGAFRMVLRYACVFFRILKLFFITFYTF